MKENDKENQLDHDPANPAESTAPPKRASDQSNIDMDQMRDANEQLVGAAIRAQEAEESADLRYRDLVEGLDAIVWEADAATGRFTFVSQQASSILGYPTSRWLEEPDFWISVIHPEDRERAVGCHKTALAEGQDYQIEYRAVASDGHVVWLAQKVRMKRTGDSIRVLGLTVDMTEMAERERMQVVLQEAISKYRASEGRLFAKIHELETFEQSVIGRELQMIKLEKEIERLRKEQKN